MHLSFFRGNRRLEYSYFLYNERVIEQNEVKYLGIIFSSNCSWEAHVNNIVHKANSMLNFLHRNLRQAPSKLRETAYLTYVRPLLEYACEVWDPHQNYLTQKIEKVQNRALRFVQRNYDWHSSVSQMRNDLGWNTLEKRRKNLRLKLFHKIFNGHTGINASDYLSPPSYISERIDHPFKVNEYAYRSDLFGYSFFVRTIREWNSLPSDVVHVGNNDLFFHKLFD